MSSYIPALQSEVRDFLDIDREIEEYKAKIKTLGVQCREKRERIIDIMTQAKITSCTAGRVQLVVKEKAKKPALSAKLVGTHVRSFFRIGEAQWEKCMQALNDDRQRHATADVSLGKKVLRGGDVPALPAPVAGDAEYRAHPQHPQVTTEMPENPATSLYA
jgi:hypothetical protein